MIMGRLVEFPLEQGGSVLVEVPDASPTGRPVTRGLGGGEGVTERAQRTFESAVAQVQPAAQAIVDRMRAMAQAPDGVRVTFGVDLHAEAGAFIAAASATATFTIELTWGKS
jgi:Trypsin-co-occurring domain 1